MSALPKYYTENESRDGKVLIALNDRSVGAQVAMFYDLDEAHKAEKLFNWNAKEQAPIRSEINNRS